MSIADLPRSHKKPHTKAHIENAAKEVRSQHDEVKTPPMPEHLKRLLKKYRQPNALKASWQIANTLVPYVLVWIAACQSYNTNPWVAALLGVVIGVLMIRIFVLHHDCTHNSFFKSRNANEFWGLILGALVMTPFHRWRRSHNYHHAHSGDLDHRGEGYITMHTVEEYKALSSWEKLKYRAYRNPLFMLVIGPFLQFVVMERFTFDLPKNASVARWGVWKTNAILASIVAGFYIVDGSEGLLKFVTIFTPAAITSSFIGVWLFFVQHNYDKAYFKHHGEWNYAAAALEGSSFYDLPQFMHWLSANIGFHHIHHLDCMVPNYNLQACHYENVEFQTPYRISLWSSRKCVGLDLFDESTQRLVPISAAK
jgi:acyl-lipid omega-6 desaturase (Delta-12 desaturase)